jgi:hypothetical protein
MWRWPSWVMMVVWGVIFLVFNHLERFWTWAWHYKVVVVVFYGWLWAKVMKL